MLKSLSLSVLLAISLFSTTSPAFAEPSSPPRPKVYTYGLHLFFDEKEFIDVLTIQVAPNGKIKAHMSVPNDFEADALVTSFQPYDPKTGKPARLRFDVLVPANASRPNDLVFHYEAEFFDRSLRQMKGFVTLSPGGVKFVASFVGFQRK